MPSTYVSSCSQISFQPKSNLHCLPHWGGFVPLWFKNERKESSFSPFATGCSLTINHMESDSGTFHCMTLGAQEVLWYSTQMTACEAFKCGNATLGLADADTQTYMQSIRWGTVPLTSKHTTRLFFHFFYAPYREPVAPFLPLFSPTSSIFFTLFQPNSLFKWVHVYKCWHAHSHTEMESFVGLFFTPVLLVSW